MRLRPSWQLLVAIAALTPLHSSLNCLLAEPALLNADQIMQKVVVRNHLQDERLCGYSCERRYVLSNPHLHPDMDMAVRLTYGLPAGKKLTVLHTEGANAIAQRVLMNIFEEEEKASAEPSKHDLTPSNYHFELMESELWDGRRCYRVRLMPLQKDKLLLDGFLLIDERDFAVVHLEGRPARNLSFWVGRPFVKQDSCKFGDFWMPCHTDSDAQVRLVGKTELRIQYSNYRFNSSK